MYEPRRFPLTQKRYLALLDEISAQAGCISALYIGNFDCVDAESGTWTAQKYTRCLTHGEFTDDGGPSSTSLLRKATAYAEIELHRVLDRRFGR